MPRVSESRVLDHLYDPVYTTASAQDFYKTTSAATMGRGERVPESGNYFSGVSHYPAYKVRMGARNEVPDHVPRDFSPERSGKMMPKPGSPPVDAMITGAHRYKYFQKPIVPFLHAVPPEVLVDAPDGGPAGMPGAGGDPTGRIVLPAEAPDGKRTTGVQTDYRDGEAQTDPYTPDYVVPEDEDPEVLGIEYMKYGTHLPAGKSEIEAIERLRQKREFEKALPPITDEASFDVRRRMMEAQEMREWKQREHEIDEANEARLDLLATALVERDEKRDILMQERLEDLKRTKYEEKAATLSAIQHKRIKALRKLGKARQSAERGVDIMTGTGSALGMGGGPRGRRNRRDIIGEYADFGSKVYAPVTRLGQHPDRTSAAIDAGVSATEGRTLMGLRTLESTLKKGTVMAKTTRPKPKALRSSVARADHAVSKDLEKVNTLLQTAKLGPAANEDGDGLPAWRRRKERVVRPKTPTVADDSDEESSDFDNAVLLLQKLIRGRAVQNMMFEGKERRLELIRELGAEQANLARAEELAAEEEVRKEKEYLEEAERAAHDGVQGEVMAATLDFLSKELVRQREMARITAMVRIADETRRTREAEEAGKRQAEEAVRNRRDMVYKQLQRVHQQTAESFVDKLIAGATGKAAEREAHLQISLMHGIVAPAIVKTEVELNKPQTVVRDLVKSFLLPEVERRRVRQHVSIEQKRFADAAKKSLEDAFSKARAAAKKK